MDEYYQFVRSVEGRYVCVGVGGVCGVCGWCVRSEVGNNYSVLNLLLPLLFVPPTHRVALNEACQRGWFSYTDLCAVWGASDNMATTSKTTAKV